MTVLNRTVTYEVDQIRVVEPTDLSDLTLQKGKDYCTLVTCTPYGINSHRLLVRGHRVENEQGDAQVVADALIVRPVYIAPFIGGPLLVVLIILMLAVSRRRQARNRLSKRMREELDRRGKGSQDDKSNE